MKKKKKDGGEGVENKGGRGGGETRWRWEGKTRPQIGGREKAPQPAASGPPLSSTPHTGFQIAVLLDRLCVMADRRGPGRAKRRVLAEKGGGLRALALFFHSSQMQRTQQGPPSQGRGGQSNDGNQRDGAHGRLMRGCRREGGKAGGGRGGWMRKVERMGGKGRGPRSTSKTTTSSTFSLGPVFFSSAIPSKALFHTHAHTTHLCMQEKKNTGGGGWRRAGILTQRTQVRAFTRTHTPFFFFTA